MGSDRFAGDRDRSARALLWRLSRVLGLALAVVFTVLGASASAAVTGLERVFADTASNSSNKSVTATCPSGKRVIGAGGELDTTAAPGQVVLGFVRPDATLSSVTVQGREDENGTASSWSVRAYAICAAPPPGLQRVAAASPSDSSNKSVTATCPASKRLLGTGAEIEGGAGQAAPNDVIPGSTLQGVTVQGLEDGNGTAVNWRVRAYAICAAPIVGLQRVVATSPTDSSSAKEVFANCQGGKQLVGAGGALDGGGGEVVLDDLSVRPELQSLAVTGREDEDGTMSNWTVRAFAICAAASERIVKTGPINMPQFGADCLAGKQVTGGGGDITRGGGQVLIDAIRPSATSVFVMGEEDQTGAFSNWFLRAYAICATPLSGLEVVSNSSPGDSASSKSVSATCPVGKRVVGAGGEIIFGQGQVVLDEVVPLAGLTAVAATGVEDGDGYANPWVVTAHAVCANPPPGLVLVSAQSDPDSDFSASVPATCPSGKNLLGTGAEIDSGLGQVVLDDVRPNAALTRVTVAGLEDETGLASNWTLTAHAICANP